jgi:hypothetical protein
MSDYPPDLGGAFASDAHRRVMAHLPNPDDDPITVEDLITKRINRDPHTLTHFADASELVTVLEDLAPTGTPSSSRTAGRTRRTASMS